METVVAPGAIPCKLKLLAEVDGTNLKVEVVKEELALISKIFPLSETIVCAPADLAEIRARANKERKNTNFSKRKFEIFFRIERGVNIYDNYIIFLRSAEVIFKVIEIIKKW